MLAGMAVLGLAFALGGCVTKPQPQAWNVKVTVDPSLTGTTLDVDIVGVNDLTDLPKWQTYSVTEYWQPGNTFRRDAPRATLSFGRDRAPEQVFAATDARWQGWLRTGAASLVLIADLPGEVGDRTGNADPRRLILPLDKNAWPGKTQALEVLVQESGLRLLTARAR